MVRASMDDGIAPGRIGTIPLSEKVSRDGLNGSDVVPLHRLCDFWIRIEVRSGFIFPHATFGDILVVFSCERE